jgi:hypothetical protein
VSSLSSTLGEEEPANGSSGAQVSDLSGELPYNTFGIYRAVEAGMEVTIERYLPDVLPLPFVQTVLPL